MKKLAILTIIILLFSVSVVFGDHTNHEDHKEEELAAEQHADFVAGQLEMQLAMGAAGEFETPEEPPERDPDADLEAMRQAAERLRERRAERIRQQKEEPAGPQLTTYQGVEGSFYEVTPVEYTTSGEAVYIALDRSGNVRIFAAKEVNQFREISKSDAASEHGVNLESYKNEIKQKQDELPWFPQFLGGIVVLYRQYSGLAGWSSLIFDEEYLEKWRNTVNEIMCERTGIGGPKCWTSKICGRYADITPSRAGVLFTSPVGGAPQAVAHIEGQRSLPIVSPNETAWIYTITYGLTNPHDKTMTYNVRFAGPGRSALWWHTSAQTLAEGATASGVGASALIKLSRHNYYSVCIEFNPKIKTFDGKELGKVCNDIVQTSPVSTAPYGPSAEEVEEEAEEEVSPDQPGVTV